MGGRTNRRRRDPVERRARVRALAAGVLGFALRLVLALLMIAGTFASVAAVYLWATTSQTFAVRDVRIEGNRRATVEELAPLCGLRPGTNVLLVDLDAARRAVESHPWVRDAVVRRELPRSIVITLEERVPKALVALDDLYLVDDHGEPFKRAEPGDPLDLPVVTGLSESDDTPLRPQLEKALAFEDLFAKSALSKTAELSEIHLDPVRGLSITVSQRSGAPAPVVAHLGTTDRPRRLARLARLWKLLAEKGDHPKEVFLDNRTRPQWVVARVE